MPTLKDRVGGLLPWILFAVVVIGFFIFYAVAFVPVRRQARSIHDYLGYYQPGTDPQTWKGLTGMIADDNLSQREQNVKIRELACVVYKIQHPDQECPDGPPSTKPAGPPGYP
jgi:hypothetical protein